MIRRTLADSHVAAVTVAVLLFWSIASLFQAAAEPVYHAVEYAITAIAILGIPSRTFTIADRAMFAVAVVYCFAAAVYFGAAYLVARFAYGVGPMRSLRECGRRIRREDECSSEPSKLS